MYLEGLLLSWITKPATQCCHNRLVGDWSVGSLPGLQGDECCSSSYNVDPPESSQAPIVNDPYSDIHTTFFQLIVKKKLGAPLQVGDEPRSHSRGGRSGR